MADQLSRPTLHMQRIFKAPRALLWAAWTRPEMVVAWLGPVEWPAVSVVQDLRVGGTYRACLKNAEDGRLLWQSGVYREIKEPSRLSFTFQWENSHEDGEPVVTLVTVVFEELADGRTRMDFTHAELKSEESLAGHRYGWESTFGRLESWIATQGNQRE